jgi:heme/copper-type cytochrome/quinol oxidase subunit 2
VLHSFSFKEYGFHTDCIPGKMIMHTAIYLTVGVVAVTCQELCGYGHSGMTIAFSLE